MDFGVDISKWQGDFNFTQAMSEGVKFAIIKAGGGDAGLYPDRKFEQNYANCEKLGLAKGAYFFGSAKTVAEAEQEAKYFISLLKGKRFEYPVYYDVEGAQLKLSPSALSQVINKFCYTVESAGYFTGIYSNAWAFKTKIKDTRFTHWVASWSKNKPSDVGNCDVWQFGGDTNVIRSNKVAGVTCDQDYSYRDFPSIIKAKGLNGYSQINYTVKSGDTLTKIAESHKTTVDKIVADNNLITAGQKLIIK